MNLKIQREVGGVSWLNTVLYDKGKHIPVSRLSVIKYPLPAPTSAQQPSMASSPLLSLRRIMVDRSDFILAQSTETSSLSDNL